MISMESSGVWPRRTLPQDCRTYLTLNLSPLSGLRMIGLQTRLFCLDAVTSERVPNSTCASVFRLPRLERDLAVAAEDGVLQEVPIVAVGVIVAEVGAAAFCARQG